MYSNSLRQLGFWSAVLTAACSLLFSISGILALLKIISYPVDPIVPDIASLILAVAFMIMMVSIHYAAPQDRKHWSHMGVVLATLYAALVSIVYFVTVTVVVLLTLRGEADKIALFVFDQSGSFMQALDGLGYFFMSLATWFAAPVFPRQGIEQWIRRTFIINGVWEFLSCWLICRWLFPNRIPSCSMALASFGYYPFRHWQYWSPCISAKALQKSRYPTLF